MDINNNLFKEPKSSKKWKNEFQVEPIQGSIAKYKINKQFEVKNAEFHFKLLHKIVATNENLFKWQKTHSPNCIHCNNVLHTEKHLLWDCPNTNALWASLGNTLGINITWESIVMGCKDFGSHHQLILIIAYILYKKHVKEKNCIFIENKNIMIYVKEELTFRKAIYVHCPTKATVAIEIDNLIPSL